MTALLASAALLVLRSLRVGPFRFTPYGLCAAGGLLLAMAVARRAAPRRELDAEQVWDAGMFAIFSCFVASRALLMLRDPVAFLRFPLLVLSLPSLTFGGMAIAIGLVVLYLRRKRLKLLTMLDVFAAPSAVLAAVLEVGHAMDGSEVGMPTGLPWAVRDPFQPALGVHPVAIYGVVGSGVLSAGLWWGLQRRGMRSGQVAGMGLVAGGLLAFALDMLSQPALPSLTPWLEPGEWVALGAMTAGAMVWSFAPKKRDLVRMDESDEPALAAGIARATPEVR